MQSAQDNPTDRLNISHHLFLPPIIPAEELVVAVGATIRSMENRLQELENLLKESDRENTVLEKEHSQLQHAIQRERGKLVPWCPSRIPNDVLRHIFLQYLDPTNDLVAPGYRNPWTLVQICRAWREVAQQTPELWNRIVVNVYYPRSSARWNKREVCYAPWHMRDAVARCGQAPMDIFIADVSEDDQMEEHSVFWEIMSVIEGEGLARIRVLQLDFWKVYNPAWAKYLSKPGSSFVSLKNIISDGIIPDAVLDLIEETSTLEEALAWKTRYDYYFITGRSFLHSLHSIHLLATLASEAYAVLATCSSVETVTLTYQTNDMDQVHDFVPQSVKRLILHGPCIYSLAFSHLVHLELNVALNPYSLGSITSMVLPSLETLSTSTTGGIYYMSKLTCPSLIKLTFDHMLDSPTAAFDHLSRSLVAKDCLVNPQHLEMKEFRSGFPTAVVELISKMSNIEKITLDGCVPITSFWNRLYSSPDGEELFCPKLQEVILCGQAATWDATREAINAGIQGRANLGKPVVLREQYTVKEVLVPVQYQHASGVVRDDKPDSPPPSPSDSDTGSTPSSYESCDE